MQDLDIRPESLPPDIGAAARALWERGEHRAALALLYRGMLSRLAHVHEVPIRDSSTEGDCLALAARKLDAARVAYVTQLVRTWQRVMYGGMSIEDGVAHELFAGFAQNLDASTDVPGGARFAGAGCVNLRWLKIGAAIVIAGCSSSGSAATCGSTQTQVPLPLKGEAVTNPYYAAIRLAEQLAREGRVGAGFQRARHRPVVAAVELELVAEPHAPRAHREMGRGRRPPRGRQLAGRWRGGIRDMVGVTRIDRESDAGEPRSPDDESSENGTTRSRTTGNASATPTVANVASSRNSSVRIALRSPRTSASARSTYAASIARSPFRARASCCGRCATIARIEALRVAVGRGSVTVLNVLPFRYRDFFQGDHPSLFVAATQLHHGDDVFFFTEEDHASLLALTWRYGAPVVLLLAALVVLALWRIPARFGPLAALPEQARRSLAEQIRGTGQFIAALRRRPRTARRRGAGAARSGSPASAAYDRMTAEERVAALAKLTGVLASELAPALDHSGARSPHELRKRIAVLETARRQI